MAEKSEFELVEPFDTPQGSMDGVSPEYAFALGVEWAMFRARLLSTDGPFKTLCLPENRERFVKMVERHRRFVEDRPTACVEWTEIWVGDPIAR